MTSTGGIHTDLTFSLTNIDLSKKSSIVETMSDAESRKFLGGNGIAAKVLYERMKPGTDAFSPGNIFFIGNGPLAATGVQGSDRTYIAAKSPLTGLYFDSTMGGRFATSLKLSGYDALVITGKAKKPSYIFVSPGGIEILDATDLMGKSPEQVRDMLSAKHKNTEVCSIGIAGENLVKYASIIHPRDKGRPGVAGRGGMGAVLGSKNVKAIVVQRGNGKVKVHSDALLSDAISKIQTNLKEKTPVLSSLGTANGVEEINTLGGFGTRNLREEVFALASNINAKKLKAEYYRQNVTCFSCPVACGKLCELDGKMVKSPEYETLYSLGAMIGVGNLDSIIQANALCDEYGVDTMSMGVTLAFAIECFEKGLLSSQQTKNRTLKFGDPEIVLELIRETANRQGIGDLLAEGTKNMSTILGGDAWKYAHQVKGLEVAGHSARMVKTLSIGYATNTRGGSHQDARVRYGADMDTYDSKVELAIATQNLSSLGDSLTMCRFVMEAGLGREFNDAYCNLLEAVTGWKPSITELKEIGERIVNLERLFNVRERISRKDDTLPYKVMWEEIPQGPHKGHRIPPEKLQEMLDKYYALRGWDKNGVPERNTLERLGLANYIG